METEWQKRERKLRKKAEMLRLCRLLDIEDWDQNQAISSEIKKIVSGVTRKPEVSNKNVMKTQKEQRIRETKKLSNELSVARNNENN
ncbi:flagellar motor switch protein [Enterococcus thailandicus]|uniref:flagellar motor switch protein n=1 Tax=Enterococcus thailandicus TaxID=417368 RepID=UPI0022EBA638|nr:flagellar motor switch protein [Enterococcus thailandicus]MDA3973530.1 flagellar motor switch protein [Enterococcus thailandicus]MDA3975885.1 flagellar motor switch protein [Enterococcus thailandicus]MDA3980989.1 flagellar motor switch protein [Enterococcus thailandicus]